MLVEVLNDGTEVKTAYFQMDCSECIFFNGDCEFGRLEKYRQKGLVTGTKIKTMCLWGRDKEWESKNGKNKSQVEKDNIIKYDLVVRVDKCSDITKLDQFISLPNPPRKIILSSAGETKELLEKVANTNLQILKVFNPDRRLELEYQSVALGETFNSRTDASWFHLIDLTDCSAQFIEKFERLTNQDIQQIICVPGHMYMKILCEACINDHLEVCDANIIQLSKDENAEHLVWSKERFDNE
jgi:hypothetical protein